MALFKRNETGPSVAQALSLWGDATPTSLSGGRGREGGREKEVNLLGGIYLEERESVCLWEEYIYLV